MEKPVSNSQDFEVKETTQGITTHHRWYKPQMVFPIMIFSILWFSFSIYWIRTADIVVFQAFGLVFLAVGIGLVWYIICLFLNKTITTITSQTLMIKHIPIPFPTYKNTYLKRSDIEQVYITEEFRYGKERVKTLIGYSLNILSPENKSSKVLTSDGYEKVIFLKKKIEQYMNIKPQPVEGEYIKTSS